MQSFYHAFYLALTPWVRLTVYPRSAQEIALRLARGRSADQALR
jgi:hypothetical protein